MTRRQWLACAGRFLPFLGEITRMAVRIFTPTARNIDKGRALLYEWVRDLNRGLVRPRPFDALLEGREPLVIP